jgi:hypothetical protein
MRIGDESVTKANGEKWRRVVPETDIDKCMMEWMFKDALSGITEYGDYYLGVGADGVDSDGTLTIGIAKKSNESCEIYDGLMTLFVDGKDFTVSLEFDPDAEDILPEGMETKIVYCTRPELSDTEMEVGYQHCMEMIEREYPDEND